MRIYDEYTKLMLHMEDADLTDSSDSSHTVTKSGNVTRSNTQYKIEDYSAYFDGNSYLGMQNSNDWNFGDENWTIDFWVYKSAEQTQVLFEYSKTAGGADNYIAMTIYANGDEIYTAGVFGGTDVFIIDATSLASFAVDTWHHIALVRNGSTITLYLNGVNVGSDSSISTHGLITDGTWEIGRRHFSGPDRYFNGYIDEYRISKGKARWTSNFTPQTIPYGAYPPKRYNIVLDTPLTARSFRDIQLDTIISQIHREFYKLDVGLYKGKKRNVALDTDLEKLLRKEAILDTEISYPQKRTFFELYTSIASKKRRDIDLFVSIALSHSVSIILDIELIALSSVYGYVLDFRGKIVKKKCVMVAASKDGSVVYGMTTSNPTNGYYSIGVNRTSGSEVLLVCFYEGTFRGQTNMAGSLIATTE